MSVERAADCVVGVDPSLGVPTRPTNLADLKREALKPPPKVWVDAPPGFSHAAPDTSTPYLTGPKSLPNTGDADE